LSKQLSEASAVEIHQQERSVLRDGTTRTGNCLPVADLVAAFAPSRRSRSPFVPLTDGGVRERVVYTFYQSRHEARYSAQIPDNRRDTARRLGSPGGGVFPEYAMVDPEGKFAILGARSAYLDIEAENRIFRRRPEW